MRIIALLVAPVDMSKKELTKDPLKAIRWGHPNPKLVLYVQYEKSSPRGEALIVWHLQRLKLVEQEIAVDYDVNYAFPDGGETQLVCGKTICKPCTGATFAKCNYTKLVGRNIFISHSFEFGLMGASENYEINRILYLAAKHAKLAPEVDLTVPLFQHFTEK